MVLALEARSGESRAMFDFERTFPLPVRSLSQRRRGTHKDVEGHAAVPFKPPNLGSAAMRAASADAFDLWLRNDLQRLYSAIAAEPIPLQLLRLIDGLPDEVEANATGPPPTIGEPAGMPGRRQGFEQRVSERAYFLWLEEGCPRGRAAEHWRLASALQVAHEARDDEEAGTVATAF